MGDKSPRFSVVIPLYNKEPYIAACLESVFAQSFQDYEVIVVDDGSTDNGPELVGMLAAHHPELRLIRQSNQGVSVARNRGIGEAKAEHIAFLDADDIWHPPHLSHLDELIGLYPEASLYGTAYRRCYTKGYALSVTLKAYHGSMSLIDRYFHYLRYVQFIYTSSIMMPKRVLDQVGGFPPGVRNGEDLDLWARAALNGPVAYCGVVTVDYTCGAEGQATGAHAARRGYSPYFNYQLHDYALSGLLDKKNKTDLLKYIKVRENRISSSYALLNPVNINALEEYIFYVPNRAVPITLLSRLVKAFPFAFFWKFVLLPKKMLNSKKLSVITSCVKFSSPVRIQYTKTIQGSK